MTVSEPQMGDMVHRKARQLDVVVVRTLLERLGCDTCIPVGIGFDVLMQGHGQVEKYPSACSSQVLGITMAQHLSYRIFKFVHYFRGHILYSQKDMTPFLLAFLEVLDVTEKS